MHDPSTVAWELKRPWPTDFCAKYRYYPSLLTIWHDDPETDGSDDSCGWSSPKLTDDQKTKIKNLVEFENKYLWNKTDDNGPSIYVGKFVPKMDPSTTAYNIFQQVSWSLWNKRLTAKELPDILNLCMNNHDSFYDSCQGYKRYDDIERTYYFVARALARMRRRWWEHPRFHIKHMRIQIHIVQKFKRWAFSRCCNCGKGFSWGYCPTTNQWDGEGPGWFKGEEGVFHANCDRPHSTETTEVKSGA